jgi:hypothetical protein
MSESMHDWDFWLNRLVEDEAARKVADVRAYRITEISRAMSQSDALRVPMPTGSPRSPSTP